MSPLYTTAAAAYDHSAVGFDPINKGLVRGYRSGQRIDLAPGYYDILVKAKIPLAGTSEVRVSAMNVDVKTGSHRTAVAFPGQVMLRRHR